MDKNPLEQAIETILTYQTKLKNQNYRLSHEDYATLNKARMTVFEQFSTIPIETWDKNPLNRYRLLSNKILLEDCLRIALDKLDRYESYKKRTKAGGKLTQEEVKDAEDILARYKKFI